MDHVFATGWEGKVLWIHMIAFSHPLLFPFSFSHPHHHQMYVCMCTRPCNHRHGASVLIFVGHFSLSLTSLTLFRCFGCSSHSQPTLRHCHHIFALRQTAGGGGGGGSMSMCVCVYLSQSSIIPASLRRRNYWISIRNRRKERRKMMNGCEALQHLMHEVRRCWQWITRLLPENPRGSIDPEALNGKNDEKLMPLLPVPLLPCSEHVFPPFIIQRKSLASKKLIQGSKTAELSASEQYFYSA